MKIGDRVEFLKRSKIPSSEDPSFIGNMEDLIGKTGIIISDAVTENCWEVEDENGEDSWAWHESWLKLKEEAMWDDKTVEAIKKSVVHWEEIEQMLKDGKPTSSLSTGSSSCALCKLSGFNSMGDIEECNKCPLGIRGFVCANSKSPYKIFMDNKTPINACNMKLTLKSLFYPEEEKKEVFYSRGQRFIFNNSSEWILARTGSERMAFINLENGDLWNKGMNVQSMNKITEHEFEQIRGSGTFTLKESK